MHAYETINILMIDDDSIDIRMFERTLKQHKISNPLYTAPDGEAGLEALRSGKISKPLLIILDLNMPRMNGIEFLQAIRKDQDLKDTIVFVMTTSDADTDKVEAYNFNVAGYMVKSQLGDSFFKAVDLIDNYWKTIQLPS